MSDAHQIFAQGTQGQRLGGEPRAESRLLTEEDVIGDTNKVIKDAEEKKKVTFLDEDAMKDDAPASSTTLNEEEKKKPMEELFGEFEVREPGRKRFKRNLNKEGSAESNTSSLGLPVVEELEDQPEYVENSQEAIDTAIALVTAYIETEEKSQMPATE